MIALTGLLRCAPIALTSPIRPANPDSSYCVRLDVNCPRPRDDDWKHHRDDGDRGSAPYFCLFIRAGACCVHITCAVSERPLCQHVWFNWACGIFSHDQASLRGILITCCSVICHLLSLVYYIVELRVHHIKFKCGLAREPSQTSLVRCIS